MKNIKNAAKTYRNARMALLNQVTLDDLLISRSVFLRSGEWSNAAEIVFYAFDEYFAEKQRFLFDKLNKNQNFPAKNSFPVFEELEFQEKCNQKMNSLLAEFISRFCVSGQVNWSTLADASSF